MSDFKPVDSPKSVDGWESRPRDERISSIIEGLLLNEMGVFDRQFTNRYVELKATTADMADRMRLDLEYWKRAGELRKEGKVSQVDVLHEQASLMADLSSADMRKAFSDYYQQAVNRSNN